MSFLLENAKEPEYTEQQLKSTYIPIQGRKPKYTNEKSSTGLPNYGMSPWNMVESVLAALNIAHTTYQNGLTESPAHVIELGGSLIRNTTVNGANVYSLRFNLLTSFQAIALNNLLAGTSTFKLQTPLFQSRPVGSILQNNILHTGDVEYTPYAFPLTDGTPGQILVTDGVGNVTWTSPTGTITGADNGLSLVGTEVYLGGTLLQNTTVFGNANTYNMKFEGINVFGVTGLEVSLIGSTSASLSSTTQTVVESAGLLELEGQTQLTITTPNVFNTTAVTGQILQLVDDTNGEVEFTPYTLPLTDGTSGNILSTNGSGVVSWGAPKAEVLYFTDNPLNITWPDLIASGSMALYTLPANTFTTDGDYLEYEASAVVTGTAGTIPEFHVKIGVVTLANTAHATDHAFTIITKGKIIRVSATAYFARIESSVYSPTGTLLESYVFLNSGAIVWANPNDFIYHVQVGPGDHVSELQHFVITKYLK